jgi:hypothetical protein
LLIKEKNKMKKITALAAAIALLAVLASCKGRTGPAGPAGTDGKNTATAVFQNGISPAGYSGCEDAALDSGIPNYNTGACGQLLIGGNDTPEIYRAVIKFDLTYIVPVNVSVTSAVLTLYFADPSDSAGLNTYTAYELSRSWTEGMGACGVSGSPDANVSWDFYDGAGNSWFTAGGDFAADPAGNTVVVGSVAAGSSMSFNLNPALVQSWIADPSSNFGVIIKGDQETGTGQYWASPCSSQNTQINLRPRLAVTYTLP